MWWMVALTVRSVLSLRVRSRSLMMATRADGRMPKRKVALLVSYNGKNYYGLQRQTQTELPTIEAELQRA